jgi:hypothetical protein
MHGRASTPVRKFALSNTAPGARFAMMWWTRSGDRIVIDLVRSFRSGGARVGRALCALAFTALAASPAAADNSYNANIYGHLTTVLTYTGDTTILFSFDKMPTVPNCAGVYFVIPADEGLARQQELSRLLTAYTMHEFINIGYDGQTCGPGGYILVYRVG